MLPLLYSQIANIEIYVDPETISDRDRLLSLPLHKEIMSITRKYLNQPDKIFLFAAELINAGYGENARF